MKKGLLLVTGRRAADAVREIAKGLGVPAEVRVCPADVAAFISPDMALSAVTASGIGGVSCIILPGTVPWDVSCITEKTGVPCFKGPGSICDLPDVVEGYLSGRLELSANVPADVLLAEKTAASVRMELEEAYARPAEYLFPLGKGIRYIWGPPGFAGWLRR